MSSIEYKAVIQKFRDKGDKTNWTYLRVPAALAGLLHPASRKSFRVSGMLETYAIRHVALIPAGEGDYLLPLNALMRKAIKKPVGEEIRVRLSADEEAPELEQDLIGCLQDEPIAWSYFKTLTPSHQRYFSNWVSGAKTQTTKDQRIAASISALSKKWDYGMMIRSLKKKA